MKLCFFEINKKKYVGEQINHHIYSIQANSLNFSLYEEFKPYQGDKLNSNEIKIISPLPKNKIVYGVAENFHKTANPLIFFKSISNFSIPIKKSMQISTYKKLNLLWAECELGFIVSEDIPFNSSNKIDSSYVFGHFLANDITGALSNFDHHLICSKSSSNFLHVSPFIQTDYDSSNKKITLMQDGEKLREGNTQEMALNELGILEELRNFFDIKKGDSVILGAPKRCRDRMYLTKTHKLEMIIEGFEKIKTQVSIKRF